MVTRIATTSTRLRVIVENIPSHQKEAVVQQQVAGVVSSALDQLGEKGKDLRKIQLLEGEKIRCYTGTESTILNLSTGGRARKIKVEKVAPLSLATVEKKALPLRVLHAVWRFFKQLFPGQWLGRTREEEQKTFYFLFNLINEVGAPHDFENLPQEKRVAYMMRLLKKAKREEFPGKEEALAQLKSYQDECRYWARFSSRIPMGRPKEPKAAAKYEQTIERLRDEAKKYHHSLVRRASQLKEGEALLLPDLTIRWYGPQEADSTWFGKIANRISTLIMGFLVPSLLTKITVNPTNFHRLVKEEGDSYTLEVIQGSLLRRYDNLTASQIQTFLQIEEGKGSAEKLEALGSYQEESLGKANRGSGTGLKVRKTFKAFLRTQGLQGSALNRLQIQMQLHALNQFYGEVKGDLSRNYTSAVLLQKGVEKLSHQLLKALDQHLLAKEEVVVLEQQLLAIQQEIDRAYQEVGNARQLPLKDKLRVESEQVVFKGISVDRLKPPHAAVREKVTLSSALITQSRLESLQEMSEIKTVLEEVRVEVCSLLKANDAERIISLITRTFNALPLPSSPSDSKWKEIDSKDRLEIMRRLVELNTILREKEGEGEFHKTHSPSFYYSQLTFTLVLDHLARLDDPDNYANYALFSRADFLLSLKRFTHFAPDRQREEEMKEYVGKLPGNVLPLLQDYRLDSNLCEEMRRSRQPLDDYLDKRVKQLEEGKNNIKLEKSRTWKPYTQQIRGKPPSQELGADTGSIISSSLSRSSDQVQSFSEDDPALHFVYGPSSTAKKISFNKQWIRHWLLSKRHHFELMLDRDGSKGYLRPSMVYLLQGIKERDLLTKMDEKRVDESLWFEGGKNLQSLTAYHASSLYSLVPDVERTFQEALSRLLPAMHVHESADGRVPSLSKMKAAQLEKAISNGICALDNLMNFFVANRELLFYPSWREFFGEQVINYAYAKEWGPHDVQGADKTYVLTEDNWDNWRNRPTVPVPEPGTPHRFDHLDTFFDRQKELLELDGCLPGALYMLYLKELFHLNNGRPVDVSEFKKRAANPHLFEAYHALRVLNALSCPRSQIDEETAKELTQGRLLSQFIPHDAAQHHPLLVHHQKEAFNRFEHEIREYLSSDQRQQLFDHICGQMNLAVGAGAWVGEYPLYQKGAFRIDLTTGVITKDGKAVSYLPPSFQRNPLFGRLFGATFYPSCTYTLMEIGKQTVSVYTFSHEGHSYRFFMNPSGQPVMQCKMKGEWYQAIPLESVEKREDCIEEPIFDDLLRGDPASILWIHVEDQVHGMLTGAGQKPLLTFTLSSPHPHQPQTVQEVRDLRFPDLRLLHIPPKKLTRWKELHRFLPLSRFRFYGKQDQVERMECCNPSFSLVLNERGEWMAEGIKGLKGYHWVQGLPPPALAGLSNVLIFKNKAGHTRFILLHAATTHQKPHLAPPSPPSSSQFQWTKELVGFVGEWIKGHPDVLGDYMPTVVSKRERVVGVLADMRPDSVWDEEGTTFSTWELNPPSTIPALCFSTSEEEAHLSLACSLLEKGNYGGALAQIGLVPPGIIEHKPLLKVIKALPPGIKEAFYLNTRSYHSHATSETYRIYLDYIGKKNYGNIPSILQLTRQQEIHVLRDLDDRQFDVRLHELERKELREIPSLSLVKTPLKSSQVEAIQAVFDSLPKEPRTERKRLFQRLELGQEMAEALEDVFDEVTEGKESALDFLKRVKTVEELREGALRFISSKIVSGFTSSGRLTKEEAASIAGNYQGLLDTVNSALSTSAYSCMAGQLTQELRQDLKEMKEDELYTLKEGSSLSSLCKMLKAKKKVHLQEEGRIRKQLADFLLARGLYLEDEHHPSSLENLATGLDVVTLDELRLLLQQDRLRELGSFGESFTEEEATYLKGVLIPYLENGTALQQVERGLQLYDRIEQKGNVEEAASIHEWATEILQQRVYDPYLRPDLLVLEYEDQKILRTQQIETIDVMLANPSQIKQASVGSGKTSIMLLYLAKMHAKKGCLPLVVCTDELRDVMEKTFVPRSHSRMRQQHIPFQWGRYSPQELQKKTKGLHQQLQQAIEEKRYLLTTRGDMERLQATYLDYAKKGGEDIQPALEELQKVLKLFKTQGVAIGDEIEKIMSPKDRTIFPSQEGKGYSEEEKEVTKTVFKELLADSSLRLLQNGQSNLLPEQRIEILRGLALRFVTDEMLRKSIFGENVLTCRDQEMASFFRGDNSQEAKVALDSMASEVRTKAYTLRGLLSKIFPVTLSHAYGVDYIRSKNQEDTVPTIEKDLPKEGSQPGHRLENLSTTLSDYLINGFTDSFLHTLLDGWAVQAKKEVEEEGIPFDESAPAKHFSAVFGLPFSTVSFKDHQLVQESLSTIHRMIQEDPDITFQLLEEKQLKKRVQFEEQIEVSAQDFASMFYRIGGFSGTLSPFIFHHTNAPTLHEAKEKGAYAAQITRLLALNESVEGGLIRSYLPREEDPDAIALDTPSRLAHFLDHHQEYDMIVDGGGGIRVKDEVVVEELKERRKKVIYIDDQGERKKLKGKGNDKGCAYLPKRLARGADLRLPNSAKGAILIGEGMDLDSFIQACGRMRGIKDRGQVPFVIVPSWLYPHLHLQPNEQPQLHHVLRYLILQTCIKQAQANLQKVRSDETRAIRDALVDQLLQDFNASLPSSLSSYIYKPASQDPEKEFAILDEEEQAVDVLQAEIALKMQDPVLSEEARKGLEAIVAFLKSPEAPSCFPDKISSPAIDLLQTDVHLQQEMGMELNQEVEVQTTALLDTVGGNFALSTVYDYGDMPSIMREGMMDISKALVEEHRGEEEITPEIARKIGEEINQKRQNSRFFSNGGNIHQDKFYISLNSPDEVLLPPSLSSVRSLFDPAVTLTRNWLGERQVLYGDPLQKPVMTLKIVWKDGDPSQNKIRILSPEDEIRENYLMTKLREHEWGYDMRKLASWGVGLYEVSSRQVTASNRYQECTDLVQHDSDFLELIVQAKIIGGLITFNAAEKEALDRWLDLIQELKGVEGLRLLRQFILQAVHYQNPDHESLLSKSALFENLAKREANFSEVQE